MIARARRALPGMVVSMLLAAPALAAQPPAHTNTAHTIPLAHPVSEHRKTVHRIVRGVASWYGGKRWAGHATASGAVYDETQLTAAHASLPIGSRVRVTVVGSNRSVIVTINDRPGTHRRVIDLSRGAAAELGMLHSGIAVVKLSLL
jgi:rare lipoprotein A